MEVLDQRHISMLESSGISHETIRARGYRTVTSPGDLKALGFSDGQSKLVPGLLVPIHGVDGSVVSHQLRPDEPRERNGKPVKYETPLGTKNRLDVPPLSRERILDPQVALYVTEGVKKADSAASQGVACVALSGVWNWKGKGDDGRSVPIPDLDTVPLNGREVRIVFDSDAASNDKVRAAESALAVELTRRGARVRVLRIPAGPKGEKVGLDDFLAAGVRIEDVPEENREEPREGGRDAASRLLGLVEEDGTELWRDAEGNPYATFRRGEGLVHCRIPSHAFKRYLSAVYFNSTGRGLSDQARETATNTLAAKAVHQGEVHPVALRTGWSNGKAYLALHDENGAVVEVDADGWRVIGCAESPIRFVPGPNTRALPTPVAGGSIDGLWKLANFEDGDRPLVSAWLVGFFLRVGTFPVLAVGGEQGSGKSVSSRLLLKLLDPNTAGLRNLSKDYGAWMARLRSAQVLGFDNLSGLDHATSDELCRIVSGVGFSARMLYTDCDEVVVQARMPILLNGIEDVADRPDLKDRTLLVSCKRLDDGPRRTEMEIEAEFDSVAPSLLGALLDRFSRAIRRYEHVRAPNVRLIDFARWAIAACEPGEEETALRAALERNRADLVALTAESDPFVQALLACVADRSEWTGTATELLEGLGRRLDDRQWPRDGRAVGNRLKRFAPELRRLGVEAEQLPRSGHSRCWRLTKLGTASSPTSSSSPEGVFEPVLGGPGCDDVCDDLLDGKERTSPRERVGLSLMQRSNDVGDVCDDVARTLPMVAEGDMEEIA